ncbi:hypothetical protein NIVACYA_04547 (plasmid) [Planktothrix agardhii]|jgi:hypothetical protein|uniref:Uncharacterized protein n=1 Tax=Planktothrix agardhii TaxID=1160 RepID=A0AAD1V861_PLAAG|nr:Fis family transcriptional regulator [Planktothrix agardhii NIES-204]CAD5983508.1 hypothetical protein PANO66_04372 [Planktothrix agardhii]CAD5983645.1 hypothetical protein PCC7811_04411 [Planktothrix agardhii]CAD5985618.1 hypothetical protein NIVACYA_04547 [Planktothrix agardhii]
MTYQLTINYPETFPDALQQTKAQFEQEQDLRRHTIYSVQ